MAGFGKFDSDYSALKALAYSVGVTTPENGWDSSYSIMASMYEHLVGAPVEIGTPMTAMLTEIAEGAESGEIVISDGCINEIERLNELLRTKENEIGSLTNQLEDAANNADVALFGSIGYTKDNANDFFDQLKADLECSKYLADNFDVYNSKGYDRPAFYFGTVNDEWELEKTMMNVKYYPVLDFSNYTDLTGLCSGGWSQRYNDDGIIEPPVVQLQYMITPRLEVFPYINISHVTNAEYLFNNCERLRTVGELDFSGCTTLSKAFYNCSSLQHLHELDLSSCGSTYQMFTNCYNLKEINLKNTGNIRDASYMFEKCQLIESIDMDLTSCTNVSHMFNMCLYLTDINLKNTGNIQNWEYAFASCQRLINVPELDFSNATSIYGLFADCERLETIPDINSSKCTKFSNIGPKGSLKSCGEIDCSSLTTDTSAFFGYSDYPYLTDFGGFKNLKVSLKSYGVDKMPNLTHESLMNVINKLGTVSGKTLKLGSNLSKLTSDEIAIATAKGWSLT